MNNIQSSKLVVDFLIKESKDIHRHDSIIDGNYRFYSTNRFSQFAQRSGFPLGTYASIAKLWDVVYKALILMWNQECLKEIVSYLTIKSEKFLSLLKFQKANKISQIVADSLLIVSEAKIVCNVIKEVEPQYVVERSYDSQAQVRLWKGCSELDIKVGVSHPLKGGCKDSGYVLYPVERLDLLDKMDCLYRVTVSHLDNVDKDESFIYDIRNDSCRTRYSLDYRTKEKGLIHRGLKSLKVYGFFENHTSDSKTISFRFGKNSPFVRQKTISFDYDYIIPANTKGFFYFNESVYALFEEYISLGEFKFDISKVNVEMVVSTDLIYNFQIDSFIDMKRSELILDDKKVQSRLLWFFNGSNISKPIGYTDCVDEDCNDIYEGFGETLGFLKIYEKSSGLFDLDPCCEKCFLNGRLKEIDVIGQGDDPTMFYKRKKLGIQNEGEIVERIKRKYSKTFIVISSETNEEEKGDPPKLINQVESDEVKDEED